MNSGGPDWVKDVVPDVQGKMVRNTTFIVVVCRLSVVECHPYLPVMLVTNKQKWKGDRAALT